jgi:hypothetical protein
MRREKVKSRVYLERLERRHRCPIHTIVAAVDLLSIHLLQKLKQKNPANKKGEAGEPGTSQPTRSCSCHDL